MISESTPSTHSTCMTFYHDNGVKINHNRLPCELNKKMLNDLINLVLTFEVAKTRIFVILC